MPLSVSKAAMDTVVAAVAAPTWAIQCIYCIIQCIHSVSGSSPDTLRYNTYCIHCISTRYSGYGLYQPLDQIQWIRIAHVGAYISAWTRYSGYVSPMYEGFDVFWSGDVIWSDCMLTRRNVRETHHNWRVPWEAREPCTLQF